jgi:hypothetical protein
MATSVVVEERVEQADGVRAAADAGDQRVGQAALHFQDLLARLAADHRLEVAHHFRIGVRAGRRADQVVGRLDVGHPVAERLVHGVLERAVAPDVTGIMSAPSSRMRKTFGFCRSTSVAPM